MRFAASIVGLREQRDSVRRELDAIDQLTDSVMGYAESAFELSPDGRRRIDEVLQKLRAIRRSISFRYGFLDDTANEIEIMVGRDREIVREMGAILSDLGIEE